MKSSPAIRSQPGRSRRVGAVAGPALLGALLLASCGGDGASSSSTTIDLSASSTAFVTRPPATTEPPADTTGGTNAEGVVEGTQEYEVQSGDYPLGVADRFGVSLDDLIAVNEWAGVGQFPFPGTVILIPPGGRSVAEVAAGTATEEPADPATEGSTPAGETTEPAATIPDAGDNCAAGSHTIVEGDYPGKVASQYDVTVEALNAANAGTNGYGAFIVGLEIVIPAKSDC